MFIFGNPDLKQLQKIVNHPERYDPNELMSYGFTF